MSVSHPKNKITLYSKEIDFWHFERNSVFSGFTNLYSASVVFLNLFPISFTSSLIEPSREADDIKEVEILCSSSQDLRSNEKGTIFWVSSERKMGSFKVVSFEVVSFCGGS